MMGNSSLLAAVLTVVSLASLSFLFLLCLRCKRKSKIIQEEHQIYNPQTFHRGGSVFTVTKSKAVTRMSQMTSTTLETHDDRFPDGLDDDYENVSDAQTGTVDPMYVDPLPMSVYENEPKKSTCVDDDNLYANTLNEDGARLEITEDDDDYENSEFLGQLAEDTEPDYENANGECV